MTGDFWETIGTIASTREANVEAWLVQPLLEALGHDRTCIDRQTPIVFQEGREQRLKRADFVVYAEKPFSRATSLIVVEAKRTGETLGGSRAQGESYAQNQRSPMLLLTNGQQLEVWQIQLTTESVRVFDCNVAELANRRGDLESFLSKEAIKEHCRSIEFKRFDVAARDLGAYERAELIRIRAIANAAIPRTLNDHTTKQSVAWSAILATSGALVLGSSGYGKTMLAAALLKEGFEQRIEGAATELPCDVFLPDLALAGQKLEDFLAERIAARKPGFSPASLSLIAREQGLLVIADAFERVAPDRRGDIKRILRNMMRDYPKAKLVLLSRANAAPDDLRLPTLVLNGYAAQDLQDLAHIRTSTHPNAFNAFISIPDHISRVAEVPLLADRLLDHYQRERQFPSRLTPLYEAWLSSVLAASRPVDQALARELLGAIAGETAVRPISVSQAMVLAGGFSNPRHFLEELAEADAIVIRGATLELQHEALADYLRALRFWTISAAARAAELAALRFDSAAQFAMLLVDTAPHAEWRRQAWQTVAKADIRLAIRSLRFAGGDETFGTSTADAEARRFLNDIRETIETLLATHLAPVADRLRETIAGEPIAQLAVEGTVNAEGVGYAFLEAKNDTTPVVLRQPASERRNRMYMHALRRVGYGPEAGRILGVQRVKDALYELLKGRDLRGGPVWIEERVFGRLRHLAERYDAPVLNCSLQEAYDLLETNAANWVFSNSFTGGQQFSIRELRDEITWLTARGKTDIDKWWVEPRELDLHSSDGQQTFARTLDEYYRRLQLAYAEVVEQSFAALRPYLDTLRMMPLRLQIEIEIHTRRGFEDVALNYRRWPVETFDKAGADVSFPEKVSNINSARAGQEYVDQTDALLRRLGRFFPDRIVVSGGARPPDFRGDDTTFGGLPDESCVVRGAMAWLKDDLDRLFAEVPSYSPI